MKNLTPLLLLFILCFSLLTGCGVSKDSYDAAVKEANELRVQLSNMQADLTTTQADLSESNSDLMAAEENLNSVLADRDSILDQLEETEADLATAKTNLSKSNTDLAATQQMFTVLNNSVKTYQPYVNASALWLDAYANYTSWDQNTWDTWRAKMATAVSGNQELQTAWDKIENTTGAEHDAAEAAFTELLLQQLNELIPETQ